MGKLKKKDTISLKKAVIINAASKYIKIVINLLFTVILARLLSAEEYGIVAVITVFTTFFSVFSDMGFGPAVIQNKELTNNDINNIYSFTCYLGIALGLAFMLFSYPLTIFYNNNVYLPIGSLLSVSLFFNTANIIPNAVLLKEKRFLLLGIRTISVAVISGIVTVVLAALNFSYYSIVISSIVTSVLTYFWNITSVKLRFKKRFDWDSIKKIWGFSISQFAFNFVNYFSRNMDNLLTGKFMGNAMLGYYDKAYKLMQYPTSNLTHVITPVLHPILSEYQDDKKFIYDHYIKIVKLLAVLGVFISAFCYLASGEIIHILYGSQWNISIPCFTWLSISVWAQMITSSTGAVFQSLGDTKRMFWVGSFNAVLNVIAIIIGVLTNDITKLALCVSISYNIHFISTFFVLIQNSFKMSYFNFLKGLSKEIFIAILLMIGILIYPFNINHVFLGFTVKLCYLGVIYLFGLVVTKEYLFVKDILKSRKV